MICLCIKNIFTLQTIYFKKTCTTELFWHLSNPATRTAAAQPRCFLMSGKCLSSLVHNLPFVPLPPLILDQVKLSVASYLIGGGGDTKCSASVILWMAHGFSLGKVPEATLEMKVHIRNWTSITGCSSDRSAAAFFFWWMVPFMATKTKSRVILCCGGRQGNIRRVPDTRHEGSDSQRVVAAGTHRVMANNSSSSSSSAYGW